MRMIWVLLAALLLASCGGTATPITPTTAPTTVPTTAAPAPTEVTGTEPTTAPVGTPVSSDSPEGKAIAALAEKLGVSLTSLQLQNVEEMEWPDSSLGCPRDDMMYTQVITPGFKITLTDGTKTYEVHTDSTGSRGVLCENGVPADLGSGS